jgi:hypothetical protein
MKKTMAPGDHQSFSFGCCRTFADGFLNLFVSNAHEKRSRHVGIILTIIHPALQECHHL